MVEIGTAVLLDGKEETIEDMFRELEDGEGVFTYEKPKKIKHLKEYDYR